MSRDGSDQRLDRSARFESFEERLVLSAHSVADFYLDSYVTDQVATEYIEVAPTLNEYHQSTGVSAASDDYGFIGNGQTVAVIDSGIGWDHYALGGGFGGDYRVVGGWDFAENDADPYDDGPAGFHGTHVSGIIGSSDSSNLGVASGVDLVGLRVFNDQGGGYLSWVEEALNWVHEHRNDFENPITTVNLSLGTNWNSDSVPNWATLEDEFAQLKEDGIFISVAAGNSFASFQTPGLSYPAASPFVVPVASHGADGMLSDFTQRNDRVIAAPGESVSSTVPDHLFGSSAQSSRFLSASGTSMAAPYMAGASVLVREAMEFVGYENITQDTIYSHIRQTAEQVWDSATNAYYHRLDLESALSSLIVDEHGDSMADASSLGTLMGGETFNGTIGKLSDRDAFSFTAGQTGRMTLDWSGSHDFEANWNVNGANATISDGVLSFDVEAGKTYSLELGTNIGIGQYDVNVSLQATQVVVPEDWGVIFASTFETQQINGERQYEFTAGRDGLFTVEAMLSRGGENIGMEAYDSSGNLIASTRSSGDQGRLDFTVREGDTILLKVIGDNDAVDFRLSNVVGLENGRLQIHGTAGDDQFQFSAADRYTVSVNGVSYSFDSSEVSNVSFSGGRGNDQLRVTSTAGSDRVVLRVGEVSLTNDAYQLTGTGIEAIHVDGGGGVDSVHFYDSLGNDAFFASSTTASLTGAGFSNSVHGFARIFAYASSGSDTAELTDSIGNDNFVGRATYSTFRGSEFYQYVRGFDEVVARSIQGGSDTARIYDTAGDETFTAGPDSASMQGSDFRIQADGFGRVYAFASQGGHDMAHLFDSAGNDTFFGRSDYSMMRGTGFYNYAHGFEQVVAHAVAGGEYDRAFLYDTYGNDIFEAHSNFAMLSGNGFSNRAEGFSRVYAFSRFGGNDQAIFRDSAGDDTFFSSPTRAYMKGSEYYNFARGFSQVVGSSTSGNDIAVLRGSDRAESLNVSASRVRMTSDAFQTDAVGFERVNADGGKGADTVIFAELANGSLIDNGNSLRGRYSNLDVQAYGFALAPVAKVAHEFDVVDGWFAEVGSKRVDE